MLQLLLLLCVAVVPINGLLALSARCHDVEQERS
jgi:hypothetical protein